MKSGFHDKFYWFQTSEEEYSLYRFLNEFQNFLFQKFICITAYDSGNLLLSSEEFDEGWTVVDSIPVSPAYLPKLHIPSAGFDEWYVFDTRPTKICPKDIYVNLFPFDLSSPSELTKTFWSNLRTNNPILYLSEGTDTKVVTSDKSLNKELLKYWC